MSPGDHEIYKDSAGCEHSPYEEWVGFPIIACTRCGVPWPCPTVSEAA